MFGMVENSVPHKVIGGDDADSCLALLDAVDLTGIAGGQRVVGRELVLL
jgi:hypothetical protein